MEIRAEAEADTFLVWQIMQVAYALRCITTGVRRLMVSASLATSTCRCPRDFGMCQQLPSPSFIPEEPSLY
jgi:hypothetical protein